MSKPMPSAMYGIIADIASTVGYGANLKVGALSAGLDDGSFKVDMAECDENGRPLTVAMLDNLASSHIPQDAAPNQGPSDHDQLDGLVARLLSRPEATPWMDGVSPAQLLSGLVRHDMSYSLKAVLSRPDAWPASRIDADYLNACQNAAWPSSLSHLPTHHEVMSLYHLAADLDVSPKIVSILADHGLNPTLPLPVEDLGLYPLAMATSTSMVDALIQAGANPWVSAANNTPLSVAWSRNGMSASGQADLSRALRQASQKHAFNHPGEAFALARTLAGPRAVQAAMDRHGLDILSQDETGLCLADHVFLGVIEAPSRTSAECVRQSAMLKWASRKMGQDATLATQQRQQLASLRHGALFPSAQQQSLLVDRLDEDVTAGVLPEPAKTAALLLNAACQTAGDDFPGSTLAIAMLDRMARAAEANGPWAVPFENRVYERTPAEHLYQLLTEWAKIGAGPGPRGKTSSVFEKIARDVNSHTSQTIHVLLPWVGALCLYDQIAGLPNSQGLFDNHPVQHALSAALASGASIDASLPGFEWRAQAALFRSTTSKLDLSALSSRLDQARMEAATPEASRASRRPMRM